MTRIFRYLLVISWFPAFVISTWWLVSSTTTNPFFAPPDKVLVTLMRLISDGFFLQIYLGPTIALVFSGYSIGALAGVILGAAVGYNQASFRIFGPIVVYLKSVPSAARVPVLLGIVGIGTQSLILAVAISVTFHVAMMTMGGVARVNQATLTATKILNIGFFHQLMLVRIPAAAGDILSALQTGLQGSILAAILVETLASGQGIGTFTQESLGLLRISHLWVSVLVIGTLGLVLNELFHVLERKLAPWYFQATAH